MFDGVRMDEKRNERTESPAVNREIVNVSRVLAEKYKPEDIAGLETELTHALNVEIAYELLLERNPAATHEEAKQLLNTCEGNPWDVPIVYQLQKL